MKKLLLASVLVIASVPGYAGDKEIKQYQQQRKDYEDCIKAEGVHSNRCIELSDFDWDQSELQPTPKPPARVTVTPPYQGPPPNRMGLWSIYAMRRPTTLFYGRGQRCSRRS